MLWFAAKAFLNREHLLSVRILFASAEEILHHAVFDRLFRIAAFARGQTVCKIKGDGTQKTEKKEGKSVVFLFLEAHEKLLSNDFFIVFRYGV